MSRARVYLTPGELRVLDRMGDGWRTPAELASELGVSASGGVRSELQNLAHRRLVERGGWGDSMRWGEWRITDAGRRQLLAHQQLELPL